MRVLLGSVPEVAGFDAEAEGLHRINGPSGAFSQLLASMIGLFLLVVPMAGLCLVLSTLAIPNPSADPNYRPPVAWGAAILGMLSFIPLHEFLHLIWHPGFGMSDRSTLVIWPAKLLFGAYYEGCMSRSRWMLMRIAPLLFLSIVPAIVIGIFQYVAFSHASKTYMEVVMVLNTVGCGADLAAIFVVLSQVPRSARMCFRGGKAYWQQAMPVSEARPPVTAVR